MSEASERWAEKKIGRPMIRGQNGELLFTKDELRKLLARPSPWRLFLWAVGGMVAAQAVLIVMRHL